MRSASWRERMTPLSSEGATTASRRPLPILSRGRRGHVPSGGEILAPRRGGHAAIRSTHGPHGEVHRTDPHDDAAGYRLPESLGAEEALRTEQTGPDADGGRAVHIRAAHDDERGGLPR